MATLLRQEIADMWAGERCTIAGKDANVCGRLEPFAIVASLDGDIAHEYSWRVVDRIMRGDRQFEKPTGTGHATLAELRSLEIANNARR